MVDNEKLQALEKVLEEGTPYGEVLAISTDGVNTVHILTEDLNMAASGYIFKRVGEIFSMNDEKQGGMNIPLKAVKEQSIFKEKFGEDYYVEKQST